MNITILSRLYNRPATTYERIIKELENEKPFAATQYQSLRSAIIRELKVPGSGLDFLKNSLKKLDNSKFRTIKLNSKKYFNDLFSSHGKKLGNFDQSFSNKKKLEATLDCHKISGNFHFSCVKKNSFTLYYFICPSSKWSQDRIDAYLECLVLLAEQNFLADRSQVRLIHLENNKIIQPKKSFIRIRDELSKTLNLCQGHNSLSRHC